MNVDRARLVAQIAHAAKGQKRANGDPYIVHPERVAQLTRWFVYRYALPNGTTELPGWMHKEIDDLVVAALLHDVLEDTGVTRENLLNDAGITYDQLDTVERLSKKPSANKTKEQIAQDDRWYYQGISEDLKALVIKCADNCANLEDSYRMLFEPVETREVNRWSNYIQKTYDSVLPMYKLFPGLRSELEWRLKLIEDRLPVARFERDLYIERMRREAGVSILKRAA